jgi:hypothetical protein
MVDDDLRRVLQNGREAVAQPVPKRWYQIALGGCGGWGRAYLIAASQ